MRRVAHSGSSSATPEKGIRVMTFVPAVVRPTELLVFIEICVNFSRKWMLSATLLRAFYHQNAKWFLGDLEEVSFFPSGKFFK